MVEKVLPAPGCSKISAALLLLPIGRASLSNIKSRPPLARTGQTRPVCPCPLFDVERKRRFGAIRTGFDPQRSSDTPQIYLPRQAPNGLSFKCRCQAATLSHSDHGGDMQRRKFIGLVGSAVVWPIAVQAQQPTRRMSVPSRASYLISNIFTGTPCADASNHSSVTVSISRLCGSLRAQASGRGIALPGCPAAPLEIIQPGGVVRITPV